MTSQIAPGYSILSVRAIGGSVPETTLIVN
jgi:hypothetical protein